MCYNEFNNKDKQPVGFCTLTTENPPHTFHFNQLKMGGIPDAVLIETSYTDCIVSYSRR